MNPSTVQRHRSSALRSTTSAARAESAYAHLKERLLEGDLGAGDKLSVVELTQQLVCSRVPVMEALKRLAGEGFVHIVPQVGCRVITPRAADVRDFFVLFTAVESTVTAFAAARRTSADLVEFKRLCAEVDDITRHAGKPADRDPRYRRLNLMFHSYIHTLARSPVTTTVAAGMWDRSDFYIKLAFGSLYFSRKVKAAHQAIRAAIIAGDAEAARSAVTAHLGAVGDGVAAQLQRSSRLRGRPDRTA